MKPLSINHNINITAFRQINKFCNNLSISSVVTWRFSCLSLKVNHPSHQLEQVYLALKKSQ